MIKVITLRPLVYNDGETYLVKDVKRNNKRYQGNVIIMQPAKRVVSWFPYWVEPLPKKRIVFYKPNNSVYLKETFKMLSKRMHKGTVDMWFPCPLDFLKTKRMGKFPAAVDYSSLLHHQLNQIIND